MRKIYATLLSAFLLGSLVCAGCTDKNKTASKEVIDIIHKVNGYWQTNHPDAFT